MDERLNELETRIAYQDHTLQELNEVIVRQQQEIDGLRRELEVLRAQIRSLTPALIAGRGEETPPPHY